MNDPVNTAAPSVDDSQPAEAVTPTRQDNPTDIRTTATTLSTKAARVHNMLGGHFTTTATAEAAEELLLAIAEDALALLRKLKASKP